MGNKKESSKVILLKEERTGRNEEEMTAKNRTEEGKKQEPEKDMFLISDRKAGGSGKPRAPVLGRRTEASHTQK